jgi:hypothetical protein
VGTPSAVLAIEGDRVLVGDVLGLVSCYDLVTAQYLYTLNKKKDEADPMDALIGGGGIHSLFRKGNLIFAGMQDSVCRFQQKFSTDRHQHLVGRKAQPKAREGN